MTRTRSQSILSADEQAKVREMAKAHAARVAAATETQKANMAHAKAYRRTDAKRAARILSGN